MYGVINKSLRDMVIEQFGEAKWSEVLQRSGVPDDSFLAMQSYDDDVTYKLAQACADEMQIDLGDALRAFGVHWVENTVAKQYETLMRAAGSDMLGFLGNLNNLHDRISSTFLNYRPPAFEIRCLGEIFFGFFETYQNNSLLVGVMLEIIWILRFQCSWAGFEPS